MTSPRAPVHDKPILVTGAAGNVGGIGGAVTRALLAGGYRVRAMVRQDDDRAAELRKLGAEVVVGDLLDLPSLHPVIEGCERMYFGMTVSPAYLEATINAASVAQHHGIKAFVNMSQMTLTQMSITETTASPQHKLHWLAEQALNWSGLPVVHMRPTVFLEGFFLRFCASSVKKANRISLPMGSGKTSPISGVDVARAVTAVLADPHDHIGKVYNLAGPVSADMHYYAQEFSAALGRPIEYEDADPEDWRQKLITWGLPMHLIDHVTVMAALNRENRYDRTSEDMVRLTGAPAMTVREFVQRNASSFGAGTN